MPWVDIQGTDVYYSQTDSEREIDDMIANCVNHADDLAEALERLTETKVINPQYLGQLGVDAINDAKAALAAYRG